MLGIRYKRKLELSLPPHQSAFLWGARKTGKSTYLAERFPNSIRYDLLKSELYTRFILNPHLFREEILSLSAEKLQYPIIADEIQRVPMLLNEIHWLIENTQASFILCGSSARKLKRGAANLLGGRAWKYNFYPLVSTEISDFNLLQALNNGLIPSHYLSPNFKKSLQAYIEDYLTEEIKAEGLTRNLPAFARFLDSLMFSDGELVNFTNISRECGVDAKTVKSYYEILVDTLLGYFIYPFKKSVDRNIIVSTPKFYLFDVGVAGYLAKRTVNALKGAEAGKAFEHFILMELIAYKGLSGLDFAINFWRTKSGKEVDFILGDAEVAIEVKISSSVDLKNIKGLIAFAEEYDTKKLLVVSLDPKKRKIKINSDKEINILPYQEFLNMLWEKEIIK